GRGCRVLAEALQTPVAALRGWAYLQIAREIDPERLGDSPKRRHPRPEAGTMVTHWSAIFGPRRWAAPVASHPPSPLGLCPPHPPSPAAPVPRNLPEARSDPLSRTPRFS